MGFTATKRRQHILHCAFKNVGTPQYIMLHPHRRYNIPHRSRIQFGVVTGENLYNFEQGEHLVLVRLRRAIQAL
jgi:hypothetical protein